jgi:hypothetical protein
MTRCPTCAAPCVEGATYCPFCGNKIETEQKVETYRCWIHKNRFAPYRCEVCGKLICKECRYEHSSRPICKVCYISVILPKRVVTMFQQHVTIRESNSAGGVGIILLKDGGKTEPTLYRGGDL